MARLRYVTDTATGEVYVHAGELQAALEDAARSARSDEARDVTEALARLVAEVRPVDRATGVPLLGHAPGGRSGLVLPPAGS